MQKSKIAEIIHRRHKKACELRLDVEERIKINRNLYDGEINTDDTYEWDYAYFDPHVFPLVRNYMSRSNPSEINGCWNV